MQRAFAEIQAEYSAAQPSRFRRTRNNLGGRADAHFSNPQHFYQLREYARDMDRNDGVFGQLVDRAIVNLGHLSPKPDTGDKVLDTELRARWLEESEDPRRIHAAGKLAFPEIEALVKRHEIIDGDVFVLPLDDGTLQVVESEWVDSPMSAGGDVFHGVRVDARGRPLSYQFLKEDPARRFTHTRPLVAGPYETRPAFDEEGEPVVLHIMDPKRASQTRGVTAFHAVFDMMGMVEDTNFAKLVQQQVVSCVAAFIERAADFQFGSRTDETNDDSTTRTLEEMSPGLVIRGKPGEKLTGFTPNVPNAEYFDHVRLLLRIIGCNIGMPLTLVLLDTTNTTFHGYRGELQQARLGFVNSREATKRRLHRPVWRWKVRSWLPDLGAAAAKLGLRLLKHDWTGTGWPYVEPKVDAEADKTRLDNMLASPRDIAMERGQDWETTVREVVEDRTLAVSAAIDASKAIEAKTGEKVGWRDLLNLSAPAGLQGTTGPEPEPAPPPAPIAGVV